MQPKSSKEWGPIVNFQVLKTLFPRSMSKTSSSIYTSSLGIGEERDRILPKRICHVKWVKLNHEFDHDDLTVAYFCCNIFEMLTGLHFLRENVVVYARWRFLITLQKTWISWQTTFIKKLIEIDITYFNISTNLSLVFIFHSYHNHRSVY